MVKIFSLTGWLRYALLRFCWVFFMVDKMFKVDLLISRKILINQKFEWKWGMEGNVINLLSNFIMKEFKFNSIKHKDKIKELFK